MTHVLSRLPYGVASKLVRVFLASQGVGSGGDFRTSGESRVFRLLSGDSPVLFDVGAFEGGYTKEFIAHFPRGVAHVFEPSAAHFEATTKALGGSAVLHNVALAGEPGEATLYKDAPMSGLASLTKRNLAHRGITMDAAETVKISTVDAMIAEAGLDRVDLLKVDVEGHELDVLRGAEQAMRGGMIGLVQFEFGGANLDTRTNLRDFFDYFDAFSYSISVITPSRIQPIRRYREALEQYVTTNYLARPAR